MFSVKQFQQCNLPKDYFSDICIVGGFNVLLYLHLKKKKWNKWKKEMVILRSDHALCTEMIGNLGEQRRQNPRATSSIIFKLNFLILPFETCFKEHSHNQIYQLWRPKQEDLEETEQAAHRYGGAQIPRGCRGLVKTCCKTFWCQGKGAARRGSGDCSQPVWSLILYSSYQNLSLKPMEEQMFLYSLYQVILGVFHYYER